MVRFPSALPFLLAAVAGVCGSRVRVSEHARPMMAPPVVLPASRAAPQRPALGSAGVASHAKRPAVTRAASGLATAGPGALPRVTGNGRAVEEELLKILDGPSSSKTPKRFSSPSSGEPLAGEWQLGTPPKSPQQAASTRARTGEAGVEEAASGSEYMPSNLMLASLALVMLAGGTATARSMGSSHQRSAVKESRVRGGLAAGPRTSCSSSGVFAGTRQQPRTLRAARSATADEDCVPLTGSTLQAALKMRCDVSGAGYAIYWANRNGEMVVAGDYVTDECKRELYALGLKKSFASQSTPYCSDVSGDGPVATVWRTKEPVFVKDVSSSSIKRKELAAQYAVTQICFAPIEAGVLEFGTSDGPLTATWEEMPECALINKAALSRGFESLGATYAMFWVKDDDKFKVAADYVSEERREELKIMRGDDLTMCSLSKDITIAADGVNPISFAADIGEEMAVVDTSIIERSDLAKAFGIHRMHFIPSEAGVLELGIPEGRFLTGDTLKASLKMTCEANGAAYALYWRLTGSDAQVAGDYVSSNGEASSFVEKSKDLTLAPTSGGPFAKVHNTGDTVFIPVASDCETLERSELAGELGIESICLIPVPGGVMEYGTTSSVWDRVEDACKAIMPKAELEKAFSGGATYVIFWRKEFELFVARATYDCSGEGGKTYASESAAVVIDSDSNSPVASAARAGIEVTVESPTVEPDFDRVTLATEFKIVRCHFVPTIYGVLEYGTSL